MYSSNRSACFFSVSSRASQEKLNKKNFLIDFYQYARKVQIPSHIKKRNNPDVPRELDYLLAQYLSARPVAVPKGFERLWQKIKSNTDLFAQAIYDAYTTGPEFVVDCCSMDALFVYRRFKLEMNFLNNFTSLADLKQKAIVPMKRLQAARSKLENLDLDRAQIEVNLSSNL